MSAKGIVLPKVDVATDPQTNPSLSQQRMFLHATLGWGYLDDANVFIPFGTGTGGSSTDEIYIDTLPVAVEQKYPFGNIAGFAKRYLNNTYDSQGDAFVAKHKARVFQRNILTGDVISTDVQFTTFAEIETYVNDNFANDGTNFQESGYVLFYDKIESSIPSLTSASGTNSIFNSFALGQYKSHDQSAKNCSFFDAVMATIFNYLHLTAFTALDFNNANARSSFWLPRNYKNYNKPYIFSANWKTHIGFESGMNNKRFQNNAGAFSQATDSDWVVTGCYMAVFGESGNLSGTYDFNNSGNRFNFAKNITSSKLRYVSFYGLESVSNPANKSVIIKPVGIDTVGIESFDRNKYDLEVVSRGGTDNSIIEKVVLSENDDGSNRSRVKIQDWMPDITNKIRRGLTTRGLPDLYFRLRDKTTNDVSKLSDFYLHTINKGNCGNGQTTFGFVINNDKK